MERDPYKLIKPLTGGGMGEVWLAQEVDTGKLVAIKFIKESAEQTITKTKDRFEREIEIVLSIRHEHILRAITCGYRYHEGQRRLYLASEYMPDGSLQDLINRTPPATSWTLPQTADVIMQAANGLDYLHKCDPMIVHLDVKPGNFLIRRSEYSWRVTHLLLNDFGLARWLMETVERTNTPIGSAGYIAPEQHQGWLTWTADQFSLAIMACLLLTGKKPTYDAGDVNNIDKWMYEQRPSVQNPDRVRPNSGIDEIILKALACDPEKRFSSVLEFATALQEAVTRQVRMGHSFSTEPGQLILPPPPEQNKTIGASIQRSGAGPVFELPNKPHSDNRSEESSSFSKTTHASFSPLKRVKEPLPLLSLRQVLKKELPGRPESLCWSPDGEYVACTFFGSIPPMILRRDDTIQPACDTVSGKIACWSPDGRLLAVCSPTQIEEQWDIRFWNRAVPAEWRFSLPFKARDIHEIDWSCRGQLAVWADDELDIYVLPSDLSLIATSLKPQYSIGHRIQHSGHGVLRWSPDGSLLAIGSNDGTLICWHADKHMAIPQWELSTTRKRIQSLAWTPDNTSLAIAYFDKSVVMWHVPQRRVLREWSVYTLTPRWVSISCQYRVSLVSKKQQILFGQFNADSPTSQHPGCWFALWSPTRPEFVTLDPENDSILLIWHEEVDTLQASD